MGIVRRYFLAKCRMCWESYSISGKSVKEEATSVKACEVRMHLLRRVVGYREWILSRPSLDIQATLTDSTLARHWLIYSSTLLYRAIKQ